VSASYNWTTQVLEKNPNLSEIPKEYLEFANVVKGTDLELKL